MLIRPTNRIVIPVLTSLFVVIILGWLWYDPVHDFHPSIPGMDQRGKGMKIAREAVKVGDSFVFFRSVEGIAGTHWPRFRGEEFDNINKESIHLIDGWKGRDAHILWKKNLGEGHAGAAVYDGRIYLLDYLEEKKSDALRCFSLKTGEELWRRWYHVRLKRNHGLSRTIPAVNEKYVVTIGPKCQVMCVDRLNGKLFWGMDLAYEFQMEVPFWYTGQCPMIDNDTAVIAVGGKSLMIGIECKTGKKVWETPNPKHWKMSHASIMPMLFNKHRMYVYIAIGGICGISADAADKGRILWEYTGFLPSVVAPSPVIMDQGRIFFTAGYGAGSVLLQLKEKDGKLMAEVVQQYKPQDGLASEQQTPIYYQGYLYGIQPKDAGASRNQFVCYSQGDCMKQLMGSGKDDRYGLGPYVFADGKFFILNDDGVLTIAQASPRRFKVLDRKQIIDGQDSWGPMAVTGGYLVMRDCRQLVCIDIKSDK